MTNRNESPFTSRMGLGTWYMGSSQSERATEVAALRAGIEAGITVIDTAEMYANGGAEEVTGEAIAGEVIAGQREKLFLVTKVLPSNASRSGTIAACERSLRRLGTEYVDLYLLHWQGSHPLEETIDAFETLVERGLIRQWGVSNFDLDAMQEVTQKRGGQGCVVNQIYYSLGERGPEFDLIPWQNKNDIATMAYCPLDQGQLAADSRLHPLADKHNATCAQIALAWLMSRPNVLPIPKSASVDRTLENARSRDILLDAEDLATLEQLFPPPNRKSYLKIV